MGLLTGITKRPGAFENGEIDPTDASQVEIYCSWPELMDAPEEVVKQLNRHMGFLRIANPGMTLSAWAIMVNDLKDKRLIPGQIRQRHLYWDGLEIRELMHKLRLLQEYGTVDLHNLPGYKTAHPAVLTSDATGYCLVEDSPVGRQISHHTGRVAHIDDITKWDQIIQRRSRKSMLTPATLFRQGIELHGKENMPERTEIMRRIPDDGPTVFSDKMHLLRNRR